MSDFNPVTVGGSAFPIDDSVFDAGMSLRDYFAAQAITALSRDFKNATGINENIRNIAKLNADLAYLVADEMLARRQK